MSQYGNMHYLKYQVNILGPIVAGVFFGLGCWLWTDTFITYLHQTPFCRFLPGPIAAISVILVGFLRMDHFRSYDPIDECSFCKSRLLLFVSFAFAFGAAFGVIWDLMKNYLLIGSVTSIVWVGVSEVLQTLLFLISFVVLYWSKRQRTHSFERLGGMGELEPNIYDENHI
eukprot:TRINITY_DN5404_c0_g1_i7.p1 TRINITY_DN5404_c0_g1~~TRINITY_DN5404_c0_g1_i7.p1  ORF type:complete len:171 (+),score=4.11 TRINITY_DN5404_c0_g1_i7:102-614(+)